jgi:hypothetical protein
MTIDHIKYNYKLVLDIIYPFKNEKWALFKSLQKTFLTGFYN